MKELKFSAEEKFIGKRLDIFLQSMLEEMSRSGVQKLIEDGLVKVNGKDIKKAGTKLKGNEIVEVKIPEEEVPELKPEIFL